EPLRRVHGDRLLGELGPYDLLEQASRGGQGIVFRARHRTTGRVVALKRLRAGALADIAARRRLEREVLATSGLDHPAIVRYDALEEVRGEPILVLEWIDGVPVNEWAWPLDGRAPPLERRVEVFVEICEA